MSYYAINVYSAKEGKMLQYYGESLEKLKAHMKSKGLSPKKISSITAKVTKKDIYSYGTGPRKKTFPKPVTTKKPPEKKEPPTKKKPPEKLITIEEAEVEKEIVMEKEKPKPLLKESLKRMVDLLTPKKQQEKKGLISLQLKKNEPKPKEKMGDLAPTGEMAESYTVPRDPYHILNELKTTTGAFDRERLMNEYRSHNDSAKVTDASNYNYSVLHGLEQNPEALESMRKLTSFMGPYSGPLAPASSFPSESIWYSQKDIEEKKQDLFHSDDKITGVGQLRLGHDILNERMPHYDILNVKIAHIPGN